MKRFLSMAALALAGAIMAACSGSDDGIADAPQQPTQSENVMILTTTVGLDGANGGAATRALAIDYDQETLEKTFEAGEQMAVIYKNTSGKTVKAESEPLTTDDIVTSDDPDKNKKSATFTFELKDPDCDAPIRYIYPAAMAKDVATNAAIDDEGTVDFDYLEEQDGSLVSLASSYDLCTFDAANWTSGALPSGTLTNKLAILALTLKDNITGADINSSITTNYEDYNIILTISDGTNSYTIWGHDHDGHIYVAIRPTDNANITVAIIKVTIEDENTQVVYYEKSLTGKSYLAGNIYNVSWLMTPTMNTVPLTMEALTDGTIVVNNPRSGMKYSLNGGAKITMTESTTIENLKVGDRVQFYGDGTKIKSYSSIDPKDPGTKISRGTAEVKVYGNIMSLVDEEGYATATTLTAAYTFEKLFSGNDMLMDASGLLLPATTLTNYCYENMFYNCTSLTKAPAELPAKTLAYNCYESMFSSCTSLTTAPALPATTLDVGCYSHMFLGCPHLNSVTCLATDISADACTSGWLVGVAASGTFTKAASTNWPSGDSGIPSGWTVQDAQ